MRRHLLLLLLASALLVGCTDADEIDDDAALDDFTFSSFDATYDLDVDAAGRSVLTVVETLVAEFPDRDQNRGIVRELVDSYDGHPTDLEVLSVEDGSGEPREYESDGDDEFEILTIAGEDFVRGEQTYVITYELHNVTRGFDDTDADEFYWDVNGTGWAQPFGTVTATVTLTPELTSRLTGEVDAAAGAAGADEPADIATTGSGFRFSATDLGPGENLTFAIGFEPGTFVPRDSSFGASPWPLASLIAVLLTLAAAIAAVVLRRTRLANAPSLNPVIAQYEPPRGAGVLLSSVISGTSAKATTAEILALAVAGHLRIVEVGTVKNGGSRKPEYRLEFLTAEGVDRDGREFLHAVFGAELTPGEDRELGSSDSKAVSRVHKLMTRVRKDATADGYYRPLPVGPIAGVVAVAVLAGGAAVAFAAAALVGSYAGALPFVLLVVAVLAMVAAIVFVSTHPLTPSGVELRDHLRGLKLFIEVAEADRIRMLQSPQGVGREPVDADDEAQVLQLNERLLPYAVLFGQEKRWIEELGSHYERLDAQPYWYSGVSPFNAGVFASSMSSVATSVSSSYSASSGGSTGGAVSGGGGGGGGGGGA